MELESLKELIESELAAAVYFSSPNCGVCNALRPKVEEMLSDEFPLIKFVHIEIDKSPGISGP